MNPIQQPDDFGQSLWLDNITRELLDNGSTLAIQLQRLADKSAAAVR